jgi:hypothetical protein
MTRIMMPMLFALSAYDAAAQSLPDDIARDAVLAKLPPLAPGWRLLRVGNRLIFERKEPVLVLDGNRINAPDERAEKRAARIKKHGKLMRPRFAFRLEPLWSPAQRQRARAHNAALDRQLTGLGKKHHIEQLLDQAAQTKDPDPTRLTRTTEERQRVYAYNAEHAALKAKRVELPFATSQRYSLFLAGEENWSDEFHLVHPDEAAEECNRVARAVRDALPR